MQRSSNRPLFKQKLFQRSRIIKDRVTIITVQIITTILIVSSFRFFRLQIKLHLFISRRGIRSLSLFYNHNERKKMRGVLKPEHVLGVFRKNMVSEYYTDSLRTCYLEGYLEGCVWKYLRCSSYTYFDL